VILSAMRLRVGLSNEDVYFCASPETTIRSGALVDGALADILADVLEFKNFAPTILFKRFGEDGINVRVHRKFKRLC